MRVKLTVKKDSAFVLVIYRSSISTSVAVSSVQFPNFSLSAIVFITLLSSAQAA